MCDNIPHASGIYAIVNKRNGHRYVGQAEDMNKRVHDHLRELGQGTHRTNQEKRLQRTWNRYGAEAFECVVLERVADNWRKGNRRRPDNLSLAEQYYVDEKSEYNVDKFIVAKKYKPLVDAKAWRHPA